MPSFDIVSKVDPQTLDNVINVAKKEILNRFDFRDSKTSIEFDKKTSSLLIISENAMKIQAVIDVFVTRMAKQGLDAKSLDIGKEDYASGSMVKKEVKVKTGVDKDAARKVVKDIKDSKLKVTPAQMDDMVRVTAKKIDDLQAVISLLKKSDYGIPLQCINMKA